MTKPDSRAVPAPQVDGQITSCPGVGADSDSHSRDAGQLSEGAAGRASSAFSDMSGCSDPQPGQSLAPSCQFNTAGVEPRPKSTSSQGEAPAPFIQNRDMADEAPCCSFCGSTWNEVMSGSHRCPERQAR